MRRELNQAIFNNIYVANDEVIGDDMKQPLREALAAQRGWYTYTAGHGLEAAQNAAQAELARHTDANEKETAQGGLLKNHGGELAEALLLGIYEDSVSSKTLMVDLRGLEPLTPCMPCRCATSCATGPSSLPGPEPRQPVQHTTESAALANRADSPGVSPRSR